MSRLRSSSLLGAALVAMLGTSIASTPSAASFQVQGAFQFGPAHFAIAFTDSVDIAQALQPSHYVIAPQGGAPALTVQSIALQENQRTVILTRYTHPEDDVQLLLQRLKLELPAQPPPKITAPNTTGQSPPVVKT